MKHRDEAIPVTAALLGVARVLQAAQALYLAETLLAKQMRLPEPADRFSRCEELFYRTLAIQREAAGLAANRATLDAMLRVPLAGEVLNTLDEELPQKFEFHPWRGLWRKAAYSATLAAPAHVAKPMAA